MYSLWLRYPIRMDQRFSNGHNKLAIGMNVLWFDIFNSKVGILWQRNCLKYESV